VNVRTLRFKFGITNGLLISVFFVLFGYVRYQSFAYIAARSFERGLINQADFFARNIRPTPDGFEYLSDVKKADAMALDTIRPFFVLTDVNGQVIGEEFYGYYIKEMLSAKDLDGILHHQDGFDDAAGYNGRRFRFLNRVLPSESGQKIVLHLGRSVTELDTILDAYMVMYLYSVPLVLIVAVAVGWYLAVHALKPFEEVAKTAEQITSEKLNTQIVNVRKEQEIQRLVQSFNSMVARLSQSFDQMRKFNANVAHELRTPLAILQGENEIALRSAPVPEEMRAILISNLEELGRLTRIVNDILTLAEVEAGTQVLTRRPLDLKSMVSDLADQMQLLAMERNIQIDVQDLPEAMVLADDLWIRRAVLNLLDNAIKYSRDGGKIQVSMTNDGAKVCLSVHDDGIGIAGRDLPHIFDRLFRADPARNRNTGGVGLGLSLVKWVVEAHDGRIMVTSEPDKGAQFQMELPVLTAASRGAADGRSGKTIKASHILENQSL
jgi:heavy metal sensor kinase